VVCIGRLVHGWVAGWGEKVQNGPRNSAGAPGSTMLSAKVRLSAARGQAQAPPVPSPGQKKPRINNNLLKRRQTRKICPPAMNLFPRPRDLLAGCDRRIHQTGETTMFRTLTIALAATAALAAAALAPTSASAWGWHPHHHSWGHGYGIGIYAPVYATAPVYASDCYFVKRSVMTPYGWRVRRIQVCD
jgi:hypothetical protein